jgi:predicted ferric reductase
MTRIKVVFWSVVALVAILWLATDPLALQPSGFFALRGSMVQLSGLLAMTCMSVEMILALRPRWPERWIGGLVAWLAWSEPGSFCGRAMGLPQLSG